MARTIPKEIPATLIAGDTWEFDRVFSDFPASEGWALVYVFTGPAVLTTTTDHATANGNAFEVRISGTATAPLTAGTYRVTGYVTSGDDRYTVEQRTVFVSGDPATEVPAELHDEKALAIIDAAIEGRLTADTESFVLNGRQVSKTPIEILLKLQNQYRSRVAMARRGNTFETVRVHFGAP